MCILQLNLLEQRCLPSRCRLSNFRGSESCSTRKWPPCDIQEVGLTKNRVVRCWKSDCGSFWSGNSEVSAINLEPPLQNRRRWWNEGSPSCGSGKFLNCRWCHLTNIIRSVRMSSPIWISHETTRHVYFLSLEVFYTSRTWHQWILSPMVVASQKCLHTAPSITPSRAWLLTRRASPKITLEIRLFMGSYNSIMCKTTQDNAITM